VTSFGRRAGNEHGADHHVRSGQDLLDLQAGSTCERDAAVERDLELPHPLDRLVEHPHVGLHAERDDRGVRPTTRRRG
jgi:hypothetical protein